MDNFIEKVNLYTSSNISKDDIKYAFNPDFNNTFLVKNYEINSTYPLKNFVIQELPESYQDISVKFGCELEICLKFDKNCIKTSDFFKGKEILEKGADDEQNWYFLILTFLQNTQIKYGFTEYFKQAYIVSSVTKDYGFIYNFENSTYKFVENFDFNDEYQTLVFTQDKSVKCGDFDFEQFGYTFHVEIITPILTDIYALKTLYSTLLNQKCVESNSSAGFHVNVSLFNEKTQEPMYLTEGMYYHILHEWKIFEKKNYNKLRPYGTIYAKNVTDMVNNEKLQDELFEAELSRSDKAYLLYRYALENKYSSLHTKFNEVLEFRLFPSQEKINTLIRYTTQAINLFKKSVQNYLKNPFGTILKLQSLYVKVKINKNPPVHFDGFLRDFKFILEFKQIKYIINEEKQTIKFKGKTYKFNQTQIKF